MVHMGYKCKGKCEYNNEKPMDSYYLRNAEAWCTVCYVCWEKKTELRCYCCRNKVATKRSSAKSRSKRLVDVVRY